MLHCDPRASVSLKANPSCCLPLSASAASNRSRVLPCPHPARGWRMRRCKRLFRRRQLESGRGSGYRRRHWKSLIRRRAWLQASRSICLSLEAGRRERLGGSGSESGIRAVLAASESHAIFFFAGRLSVKSVRHTLASSPSVIRSRPSSLHWDRHFPLISNSTHQPSKRSHKL